MPTHSLGLPLLGTALALLSFSSCSGLPEEAAAADPLSAANPEVAEVAVALDRSDPYTAGDSAGGEAREVSQPEVSQPIEEMRWGPGTPMDAREMPPLPPEYQRMLEQYYEKLQQQQPRVR